MNVKDTPEVNDINNCDDNNSQPSFVNRRRFLELTAYSMGGLGLLYSSKGALAANPVTVLNQENAFKRDTANKSSSVVTDSVFNTQNCIKPTIPTRIISSSNTSTSEVRNQLGLQRMRCAGFDVQNPEVIQRQYLRFGGTDQQRASDLQNLATGAIKVPKVLMAARGGYGAMRLLELVDWQSLGRIMQQRQSILVGFSDVTALQCALLAKGKMSSLAGPMLYSEFGKQQPDVVSCQGFVEAITNPRLKLELSQKTSATVNQPIIGTLWGGNLSVVSALAGSPYLPNPDGGIVFLEDVGEQPYQVERMLYSLYLSGAFKKQQAIVLGTFTGTGEDSYDARYDMTLVVEQLKRITGLPVYSGLHFGHVARKQSFPLGATCKLTSAGESIVLEFSEYPTVARKLIHAEGLWL